MMKDFLKEIGTTEVATCIFFFFFFIMTSSSVERDEFSVVA